MFCHLNFFNNINVHTWIWKFKGLMRTEVLKLVTFWGKGQSALMFVSVSDEDVNATILRSSQNTTM